MIGKAEMYITVLYFKTNITVKTTIVNSSISSKSHDFHLVSAITNLPAISPY